MPGLSSIAGGLTRTDSSETDPAGDNSNTGSSGPDPALLEPLQEMTEGEEPLQVRRDLDSPAADAGADSAGSAAAGLPTGHRIAADGPPPAKRIKVRTGRPVPDGPARSVGLGSFLGGHGDVDVHDRCGGRVEPETAKSAPDVRSPLSVKCVFLPPCSVR